ncbi:peptidylprolyl isomerase [Planomonospora sp. ID67723]|uniref:peptidylprolyl isomerase n=1 Tax=Planomonospora sp. ID67723 TaxID=2738134 RepID=UPI0018C38682|nr:peptidylprolyl isomerase [Planomonospora sp. ID67723]MBG0831272.1 peptidylprolyl isomerase [Planomonospora sp. ID67723]
MSGEDRQSQLAREHKERQAQRAAEARKAKRNTFIGAGAAVAVVAGGVVAATVLLGGDGDSTNAAVSPAPSQSASASATPKPTTSAALTDPAAVTCDYRKDTSGSPTKKVGYPPKKPDLKPKTMTIATNHGDIVIDLATQAAPCTVNSLAFLAKKNFYDNTRCHRLATPENSGLGLLQCGDPQAKADGKNPTDGQGSSGYVFNDENLGGMSYTKGTVALAQAGDASNQNGSQFWISLSDETAQLEAAYTPFGTVSKGMDILEKIYAGGWITNPDDITGDGGSTAPKIPVLIKDLTVS